MGAYGRRVCGRACGTGASYSVGEKLRESLNLSPRPRFAGRVGLGCPYVIPKWVFETTGLKAFTGREDDPSFVCSIIYNVSYNMQSFATIF